MEIHIKIIGVILIFLSLIHLAFPRYFKWREELRSMSLINRQMMNVHTLFLALGLLLMGVLCISSATELVNTNLGKKICLGMGIFWATRLFVQFFGYSPELWKGKKFETLIHVVFSLFWVYLSIIFFIAYFR